MCAKYLNHLRFMGTNISYGYNESNKLTSQMTKLTKRMGAPCSFLTFSFNDIGNP